MQKVRYSRRWFMKTGLACMAGTTMNGKTLRSYQSSSAKRAVSRTSLKTLRVFPTTCSLCAAGCGLLAFLDGDRCVQILGNPDHPVNKGGICAKGFAGLNLVYDPERLLFPMKRFGQRGEGQWTRITWDEAHEMVISRLRQLNLGSQKSDLVIDQGEFDPLLDRFIQSMEKASLVDRPSLNRKNRELAFTLMTGFPVLLPDFSRSRTILNFGANPFAHHDQFIGIARRLMFARVETGARLISLDVRMSETAAKSDLWIPLKSGTDGIVALAMAHTILNKNLINSDFINRMTNTSLSALQSRLADYPPSRAEVESSIKASVIEDLAVEFATRTPSVAIAGGGVSDQKHGVWNVQNVYLLNWLVGNLEKEGGLFYSRSAQSMFFPSKEQKNTRTLNGTRDLIETGSKDLFYLSHKANPVFDESDNFSVSQFFKDETKVKFLAVFDTHMTETAMLADLVLPAATSLESWGLEYAPTLDQTSVINLRQPVVSLQSPAKILRSPDFEVGKVTSPSFLPLGEAKEIGNVCIEWARRLGEQFRSTFSARNTLEFYSQKFDQMPDIVASGGFASLKNTGFQIERSGIQNLELFRGQDNLVKISINSAPDKPAAASNTKKMPPEFTLTTYRTGFFAHETQNSKWLREIAHDNPLWINKIAAEDLDIHNGDLLRISSKNVSLVTRALVTDRIHPESVALAEGFGHTATGHMAQAEKFRSSDQDTALVWWTKEGKGINPNELLEGHRDPMSGVLSSKDTLVKVEKLEGGVKKS